MKRFPSVGENTEGVEGKEPPQLLGVVLKLVEGVFDVDLLPIWALELKGHERKSVNVDDEVGAPVVVAVDGKLLDDPEFVLAGVLPINRVDMGIRFVPVLGLVGHLVALRDEVVGLLVALGQIDPVGTRDRLHGLRQRHFVEKGVLLPKVPPKRGAVDDLRLGKCVFIPQLTAVKGFVPETFEPLGGGLSKEILIGIAEGLSLDKCSLELIRHVGIPAGEEGWPCRSRDVGMDNDFDRKQGRLSNGMCWERSVEPGASQRRKFGALSPAYLISNSSLR